MAGLGHIPAKPTPPSDQFNDGTVHRSSRRGPKLIDPTAVKLSGTTRISYLKANRRTGAEAIWYAPGAKRVKKDLYLYDSGIGQMMQDYPKDIYRPKEKIRPRRVNDSQGRDVRGDERRYAANHKAMKREQAEIVDRFQCEGFERHGGESLPRPGDDTGVQLAYINEKGDRSADERAVLLRRLNQLIAHRPFAGMTKENVCVLDKRYALYMRYVELNKKVFGCFRIDADLSFDSLAYLNDIMDEMVANGEIPFKPNMAVSEELTDGKVYRPHLLIFLPVADLVNMDRRRKRGVRDLMRAVERAWIRALAPIGADRGGATNNQRIKNPFCPSMKVGIFQQSKFMSLRDMAAFFRKRDPKLLQSFERDDRAAEKTLKAAGMANDEPSNNLFRYFVKLLWELAFAERRHAGERYRAWMADRSKMEADLIDIAINAARPSSCRASERQVRSVVASVAKHCAARFDEDMCEAIVNRGAMASLFVDTMTTTAKQQMAGPWSGKRNKEAKTDAVAEAIRTFEAREGCRVSRPTPALIAECKAAKIASRSTLFNRWDEFRLLADAESNSVDGKKDINNAPNYTVPVDGHSDQPKIIAEPVGAPERTILPVPAAERNVRQADIRSSHDLQPSKRDRKSKVRRPAKPITTPAIIERSGLSSMASEEVRSIVADARADVDAFLISMGIGRVDAMPADHKSRLLAKDSVVDVVAGIAEPVCSVDVGVPATSEPSLPSEDSNMPWAASGGAEDIIVDADDSGETAYDVYTQGSADQEPSLPSEDIDMPVAASQEVEDIVERLLHRLSRLRDAPSNLSLAGKGDSFVTAMPANRMESHDART